MFRFHVVFRPGGGAERTTLLKNIPDVKLNNNIADLLATMRQWRRWLQQAEELNLTLPDPVIMMQVLGKMVDSWSRLGGGQVTYNFNYPSQINGRLETRAFIHQGPE